MRRILRDFGVAILMLIFAAFMLAFQVVEYQNYAGLHASGIETQAHVVQLTEIIQFGFSHRYYVMFDYIAEVNGTYRVQQTVPGEYYETLHQGVDIPVLYAPDDPSFARIDGFPSYEDPWLPFIGIALAILIIGVRLRGRKPTQPSAV